MGGANAEKIIRLCASVRAGIGAALRNRRAGSIERTALSACHTLLTERGEVSGTRIAREILSALESINGAARRRFFTGLSSSFSPDPTQANLASLQRAAESPRRELLRRLNTYAGATSQLVGLRGELLRENNPDWKAIADDLGYLFTFWFNRGFLALHRINWNTPAAVLEKLIRYEAVHSIQGFPDIRRRLASDRRFYAFFHPAMPEEPIIFVQVALTRGIIGSIESLLDRRRRSRTPST